MDTIYILLSRKIELSFEDPAFEALSIAVFFLLLSLAATIISFVQSKQLKEINDENFELKNAKGLLEMELEVYKQRENDILECLEKGASIDKKMLVPIKSQRIIRMDEGSYAYFVDEDKKREFALNSGKSDIINGLVDILSKKNYIKWENEYDANRERYTVTGKLFILADKTEEE